MRGNGSYIIAATNQHGDPMYLHMFSTGPHQDHFRSGRRDAAEWSNRREAERTARTWRAAWPGTIGAAVPSSVRVIAAWAPLDRFRGDDGTA